MAKTLDTYAYERKFFKIYLRRLVSDVALVRLACPTADFAIPSRIAMSTYPIRRAFSCLLRGWAPLPLPTIVPHTWHMWELGEQRYLPLFVEGNQSAMDVYGASVGSQRWR